MNYLGLVGLGAGGGGHCSPSVHPRLGNIQDASRLAWAHGVRNKGRQRQPLRKVSGPRGEAANWQGEGPSYGENSSASKVSDPSWVSGQCAWDTHRAAGAPHPATSLPLVLVETDFTRGPEGSSFRASASGIYLKLLPSHLSLPTPPGKSSFPSTLHPLWLRSPKLLPVPPRPVPSPLPRLHTPGGTGGRKAFWGGGDVRGSP